MKLKKGDNVLIMTGKDKGKRAKILRTFPKEGLVLIEGVNIKKTHKRPKKEGEKGQVVEVAFPMSASKAQIVCPKCDKISRVGYKATEGGKKRFCKKCQGDI